MRKICCSAASAYYQLRQLRVVRKSLSTKTCEALVHAFSFVSSRLDYCNCLLYGIADKQLDLLQSVLRSAARLVLRKRKLTQTLPICETSYTGFPSNNELNTRSACLSTNADETRRLRTSSRCCILWFLPRDTTCVLSPRKCTTSLFPGHDLFVRACEVFLCPVQLSGTVCSSLLRRLRHLTLGHSRKS